MWCVLEKHFTITGTEYEASWYAEGMEIDTSGEHIKAVYVFRFFDSIRGLFPACPAYNGAHVYTWR